MNMPDRRNALAVATAVSIVLAAGPAVAGAWVTDAKSGCQVWNPTRNWRRQWHGPDHAATAAQRDMGPRNG